MERADGLAYLWVGLDEAYKALQAVVTGDSWVLEAFSSVSYCCIAQITP